MTFLDVISSNKIISMLRIFRFSLEDNRSLLCFALLFIDIQKRFLKISFGSYYLKYFINNCLIHIPYSVCITEHSHIMAKANWENDETHSRNFLILNILLRVFSCISSLVVLYRNMNQLYLKTVFEYNTKHSIWHTDKQSAKHFNIGFVTFRNNVYFAWYFGFMTFILI